LNTVVSRRDRRGRHCAEIRLRIGLIALVMLVAITATVAGFARAAAGSGSVTLTIWENYGGSDKFWSRRTTSLRHSRSCIRTSRSRRASAGIELLRLAEGRLDLPHRTGSRCSLERCLRDAVPESLPEHRSVTHSGTEVGPPGQELSRASFQRRQRGSTRSHSTSTRISGSTTSRSSRKPASLPFPPTGPSFSRRARS